MAAMNMEQLEQFFGEQFEKKMAAERDNLKKELAASGQDDAKIKEAVDAHLKTLELEEGKKKALRAEMMEQFEIAAAASGNKGAAPDGKKIVSQMIASGLKAMEMQKATNIKNVGKDVILDAAKKMFPDEKALHGVFQKEMTAGVPSAGGFTIPQVLSPDFIDYLYAKTILDKLGVIKVPLINGNLSVPRVDSTSSVGWVGETAATDQTDLGFGEVNLKAKKLKALTALSNTLLRYNAVGVDRIVSQALQMNARIALDTAFLYGAGTEYTPRGLANTTNIQTSGSSSTALGLTTPNDMIALLQQANVPMDNVQWIFNPIGRSWLENKAFSSGPFAWAQEMSTGKLKGYPFVTSSTVSYTDTTTDYADFWLVDASMLMWGVGYDLSIEMSREGTFSSGGSMVSAFDQDLTLVRIIGEHDFAVRQPKAVLHGTYSVS